MSKAFFGIDVTVLLAELLVVLAMNHQPPQISKSDTPADPKAIQLKIVDVSPPGPSPAPQPPPKVDPAAIQVLDVGLIYIPVQFDTPFLLTASPPELVKITKHQGPMKVFGKFSDGNGDFELREIKAKYFATVEAKGDGKVELQATPVGATDEAQISRKWLQVGKGPRPPPVDPVVPVPVDPKVDPKPSPQVITSFHVIFVYESGQLLTAKQNSTLYSKVVSDYLNANCTKDGTQPGWRRYDKDAVTDNESEFLRGMWAAAKPKLTDIPCICIEVNGKIDILPFPASDTEALNIFRKYNGGK